MALYHIRKQKKHTEVSIDDMIELISDEEEIETAYIKKEQSIALHRAMRKLKSEYQQVLWLIYFEDLSNKDVAKIMKKSVSNIENLVSRARKSLKKQLEMEGFQYEKL